MTGNVAPRLLDRDTERAAIHEVVGAVTEGLSGVRVLVGDAGMGKTRLLRYAVESAPQLHSVWVAGVEAEQDLGYAGLHRLLRPFLARCELLPEPQRLALESALGIRADGPADRFLIGLASLTLLANVAEERGVLCVIDDAQWLDRESLEALSFVARRLEADRIALFFGARGDELAVGVFDGLPTMQIEGLPEDASLELLSMTVDAAIDPDTARNVVAATAGCPLALIELAGGMGPDHLRSGLLDGEVLPLGRQLEDHYLRQVRELDAATQIFLLVAATEASGNAALIRTAAFRLGADGEAEDAAVRSGLIALRRTMTFRNPLVRAAVYAGAPRSLRDSVHEALAAVIGRSDPDRQVRHLAAAAREPDEALASELEQAATRARQRGGYAAQASLMLEAAQFTPEPAERSRRLLSGAEAALTTGLRQRADAMLEQARVGLDDPWLSAEAMHLEGRLRMVDPRVAPARLLAAARAFQVLDPAAARGPLVEALEACMIAGTFMVDIEAADVARAALAVTPDAADASSLEDLLLEGVARLFVSEFDRGLPVLQQAAEAMRDGPLSPEELARWCHVGFVVANELWDDALHEAWEARAEDCARETGALIPLRVALIGRARSETRRGRFAAAEATVDEVVEIVRIVGAIPEVYEPLRVDVYAWRGREPETRAYAAALRSVAEAAGAAYLFNIADLAVGTLELGRGDYAAALAAVERLVSTNQTGWTCLAFGIAIEAAARSGEHELAASYLAALTERAAAANTTWARGHLARCRALVASDADAESLHREAIEVLALTGVATELAQAHLAYGEWLRRQQRKVDAREQLRIAYEAFAAMEAEGFASRARAELEATGEHIRRHSVETANDLTPQEASAARLAATGATNAEIAARMFISASTVDYHLRKVYRKLRIRSRRELADALPPPDSRGDERREA